MMLLYYIALLLLYIYIYIIIYIYVYPSYPHCTGTFVINPYFFSCLGHFSRIYVLVDLRDLLHHMKPQFFRAYPLVCGENTSKSTQRSLYSKLSLLYPSYHHVFWWNPNFWWQANVRLPILPITSALAAKHLSVAETDQMGLDLLCLFQHLVGGSEHVWFSHILGIIIPTDFHIFQG